MPKAERAFSHNTRVEDTTIGWRFVNKLMKERHGVDSMPETAESVATDFNIEREAQDRMALASQRKALAAQQSGVSTPRSCRSRPPAEEGRCDRRREGRASSRNQPRNLGQAQGRGAPARQRDGGQPIGCERRRLRVAARRRERRDPAWTRAGSARGCDGQRRRAARIMGMGPAAATRKVLTLAGLTLEQLDVIELNEAFAAQGAKAAAPSTPATCASSSVSAATAACCSAPRQRRPRGARRAAAAGEQSPKFWPRAAERQPRERGGRAAPHANDAGTLLEKMASAPPAGDLRCAVVPSPRASARRPRPPFSSRCPRNCGGP